MKTPISVTERVFTVLNVSAVTSLLNGRIYRGLPQTDDSIFLKKNININSLPTANGDFTNEHSINVNAYCPDLDSGQVDEATLKTIGEAIITTLEAYASVNDYFTVTVIGNGIVTDEKNRSFLNIRLEIITE